MLSNILITGESNLDERSEQLNRDAGMSEGGRGGSCPPPDFGRSEDAAGQRRRAALLPAPPDFQTLLHP